jgi:hypothetical protein
MAVMSESLRNFLDVRLEESFIKAAKEHNEFRLYDENKFENADRWIEALLSGEYEQGASYLCLIDGSVDQDTGLVKDLTKSYCCLGVLTDLVSDDWYDDDYDLVEYGSDENNNFRYTLNEYMSSGFDNGEGTLINKETAEEMGFFPMTQDLLASLNDYGASFSDIAKVIAANDMREIKFIFDGREVKGV